MSSVHISVDTHNESLEVRLSAPTALQRDLVTPEHLIDEAVAKIKAALGGPKEVS